MRPDTGTACGDKPLAKRGCRVRALLENLRTAYGRVKGEQGLPGKHLPVWDRGLPPVPAAPSPRCLVPACVPSSLPQLALPPSLLVPRTGRGDGAILAPVPPTAGSQLLPPAQAGGCGSSLVATVLAGGSPSRDKAWMSQLGRTEPSPHHQHVPLAAGTV